MSHKMPLNSVSHNKLLKVFYNIQAQITEAKKYDYILYSYLVFYYYYFFSLMRLYKVKLLGKYLEHKIIRVVINILVRKTHSKMMYIYTPRSGNTTYT